MAKYQLDDMNNQITYLNKIIYNKRNEIAYLKIGAQELEGYVRGLENHNQQQHKGSQLRICAVIIPLFLVYDDDDDNIGTPVV